MNDDKLTIYTKMNIYYCDGINKPELIAKSLKDLFNNDNAKDCLPTDKEEFNDLKSNIYYCTRNNDLVDVDYSLSSDYNIFICKNSLLGQLTSVWGLATENAKKDFTNLFKENANNKLVWKNIAHFYDEY